MSAAPFADIPFSARLAWSAQGLARWAHQMALSCAKAHKPLADAVFDLLPQGKSPEEAYLRAADPAWWRRNAARKLRIAQEVQELRRGVIGSDAQKQYAGVKAEEWAAHTKKATNDFLKHSVVYDPGGGEPVPLAKIFKTPAMLAARYYTFLKGGLKGHPL